MVMLIVGLLVFLGVHMVSVVAPGWRDAQAARLGEGPWKRIYSLISLAGFVLLVWGYGDARANAGVWYSPPTAMRHVALVLMLPVFPLLVAAYARGRIQRRLRHPMLIAVILWSAAHLIANGSAADVVLFASFGAWAVIDLVSVSRRPPRAIPGAPFSPLNDGIAVVVGLGLYAAFVLGLHRWLIGVSPLP